MIEKLNFSKLSGLIPAIIQDALSRQVLMVGFMNREAVEKSIQEGKAIFWSRSKQRLWQKGETSGNYLKILSMDVDCDGDALLVQAEPRGPVCHTGSFTCFGEDRALQTIDVLTRLEQIIQDRKKQMPEGSYTTQLLREGTPRIAQKVGEEAVEVVVAAFQNDSQAIAEESADLLYHLTLLLAERGLTLSDVTRVLELRMSEQRSASREHNSNQ